MTGRRVLALLAMAGALAGAAPRSAHAEVPRPSSATASSATASSAASTEAAPSEELLTAASRAPRSAPRAEEARVHAATPSSPPLGSLAREFALLTEALADHGRVTVPRPRLWERGERRAPPSLGSLEAPGDGCVTLVVLGTRNAVFVLESADETPLAPTFPVPSSAGMAALSRCGPRRSELAHVRVVLRSSRALLETAWLESAQPLPPLAELLPSRDPGHSLPSPRVGPRPPVGELLARVRAVEEANARRGATSQRKSQLNLDRAGQGSLAVTLEPGCHRLTLLAAGANDASPDLDARLIHLGTGQDVARDESESSQAELRHCSGQAERYLVSMSGGTPGAAVTLLSAQWPLARGLPVEWGPLARATMADALWREHPPRVERPPVQSFMGVQGRTEIWLDTRPDGCYLVGVGAMRGTLHRMVLDWEAERLEGRSRAPSESGGTSGAFCAGGASRVRVRVTSMGDGLAWLLAAWEFPEAP